MFLDEFQDAGRCGSLTVLRASSQRPIVGWATRSLLLVMTHYFRGRSLPCVSSEETPCCLCAKNHPTRLYGYLGILTGKGTSGMVELTMSALNKFLGLTENAPQKQVPRLKVYRTSNKKNAPLDCEIDWKSCEDAEWDEYERKHPDKDIMRRSLTRLWELPHWPTSMNEAEYDDIAARYIREIVAERILEN